MNGCQISAKVIGTFVNIAMLESLCVCMKVILMRLFTSVFIMMYSQF